MQLNERCSVRLRSSPPYSAVLNCSRLQGMVMAPEKNLEQDRRQYQHGHAVGPLQYVGRWCNASWW